MLSNNYLYFHMLQKLCPHCNAYMTLNPLMWGWLKCSCGFAKKEEKVVVIPEVVSLKDYWMGRNETNKDDLTPEIVANAKDLLQKVNALLADIGVTRAKVNSGWRPPADNQKAGGAKKSNHMTGNAIDLDDDDKRTLSDKITDELLERHELWTEHPDATHGPKGTWCHLQRTPPGSGKRRFYP